MLMPSGFSGRKLSSLVLACLGSLLLAGSLQAAIKDSVQIETGTLIGIPGNDDPSVTQFLGIPYAAPPVGDLRWRAPQAPASWPGVRTATRYSATCAQHVGGEGPNRPWTIEFNAHGFQSEDCLYLNVWTPAQAGDERLPVLVYIYGGGNREGSSDIPIYHGEGLARKGVVVVTINYRLNVFGFLALPELSAESDDNISGNYGFMDQLAALRWVQRNIAAFGGDSAKVTVAGQSAGACDVHFLAISPTAKGLFRGAIAQSDSKAFNDPVIPHNCHTWRTPAVAEQQGETYAASLGTTSLEELRAMSWQQILSSEAAVPARMVVGGEILPRGFAATYAAGEQSDVPFFTGSDKDEYDAMTHPDVDAAGFRRLVRERFGDMADQFLQLYVVRSDAEAPDAYNALMRDYERTSMYLWTQQRGATSESSTYTYFWTHPMPGSVDRWGAFHCSEIPYFLHTLNQSPRPFESADYLIEEQMSSYYANFVKTGDPNGVGLAPWPAVKSGIAETMELGEHFRTIPVAEQARFDLLMAYFVTQKDFR